MEHQARLELITLWLEKARDDLAIAEDDLKLGHTRGTINRSYYAIFHAASAALLWRGEEYGRIYTRARKEREEVDYKPASSTPSPEEADVRLAESRQFVERIHEYLREVGAMP